MAAVPVCVQVRAEQAMQKYGDLDRLYEDKDSF